MRFLLLPLLIFSLSQAYAQEFQWATTLGSGINDHINGMDWDRSKNIYVTGDFRDSVVFNTAIPFDYDYAYAGSDIFTCKFDSNGTLMWAKMLEGKYDEVTTHLVVDDADQFYISGWFQDSLDLEPDTNIFYPIASLGAANWFIAKYDSSGQLLNHMQFAGQEFEITSMVTDTALNLFVLGTFEGSIDFDPGPGSTILTAPNYPDVYFAKYDRNGQLQWVKQIGQNNHYDFSYEINIDTEGSIYICGRFYGDVDFDPGPGQAIRSQNGQGFMAKYDNNGNYQYVIALRKSTGIYTQSFVHSVCIDDEKNAYIVGDFQGYVDFDPGPADFTLEATSNNGIYLSKYNASGQFLWAITYGGWYDDNNVRAVRVDPAGNPVVTGFYEDINDFDPDTGLVTLPYSPSSNADIFLAKYSRNGEYMWARGFVGSNWHDEGEYLLLDETGAVYLAGLTTPGCDLDPSTGKHVPPLIGGDNDIFIAKYAPCAYSVDTIYGCKGRPYTFPDGETAYEDEVHRSFVSLNECEQVITTHLIFNDSASAVVKRVGNTLMADKPALKYEWLDCRTATILPNDTLDYFTPEKTGDYALVVSSENCKDTSNCFHIDLAIGIAGQKIWGRPSLHPNPFQEQLTLIFEIPVPYVEVEIFNMQGQRVYVERKEGQHSVLLRLDFLQPGIYVASIRTPEGSDSFKIVKETR